MEFSIFALVCFPDNIVGQAIEELFINELEDNYEIKFKPLSSQEVRPNAQLRSPYELQSLCEKAEEQRYVRVKLKTEANDDRQAWLVGSKAIESFCSWLTFLCLKPFDIVSWDAVIGGSGNVVTASKLPNVPQDKNPLIRMTGFQDPENLDLTEWIVKRINPELSHILRWYRKSTMTPFPEEKLIFLVTAMEGASEALEQEGERSVTCPSCKSEFSIGPSVSKSGLLNFIRNNLGYSRNKLYEPIWKQRSKFVHASNKEANSFSPELTVIIKAANALAISIISYYLLTATNLPFRDKDKLLGGTYVYHHPVKGELSELKACLEELVSLRLA